MADMIDRQALLDVLHERLCNPKKPEQSAGIAAAERIAQNMPTVGPKRGEWVIYDEFNFGTFKECSLCKELVLYQDRIWNYCPNCGADMRGDKE